MTAKEFITRWRTEIVRGVLILGVVFGIGMFVVSMVGRGKAALNDFGHRFDANFAGDGRPHGQPWMYVKPLAPDHTLWLRNINGSITVTPSDGQTVEIHAERTYRHSPGDSVRIVTAESNGGLTVCAVWPGRSSACGPEGHFTSEGMHGNDVAVVFEVKLPRGVRLDASTITGDVSVDGATAPVNAVTVTGDVTVETADGPVTATTVTGDVHATMHALAGLGDVKVTTVTGDAQVDLPRGIDAVVDGHTVAGDISTDFSLPVTGKFASHSLTGTLGKGGRQIHISTVTGDVDLREAETTPEAAPVIAPVPPPHHPPAPARGSSRPRSGTS
jgi:cytoskeletal protein CcmA (bactofilin family)